MKTLNNLFLLGLLTSTFSNSLRSLTKDDSYILYVDATSGNTFLPSQAPPSSIPSGPTEDCNSLSQNDDFFDTTSKWCHKIDECLPSTATEKVHYPIIESSGKITIQFNAKGHGLNVAVGGDVLANNYEYKVEFGDDMTTIFSTDEQGRTFTLCEKSLTINTEREYKFKFIFDSAASAISLELDDDLAWTCPDQPWNEGLNEVGIWSGSDSVDVCQYKIQTS
jgi:hypothetical protein